MKSAEQKARDCERARRWRLEHPEQYREQRWLRYYGINAETYHHLLESQGNRCAICGTESCASGHHMSVDHDHLTGKVRGLLCKACNMGLGKFHDSPDLLRNAIEYLSCQKPALCS